MGMDTRHGRVSFKAVLYEPPVLDLNSFVFRCNKAIHLIRPTLLRPVRPLSGLRAPPHRLIGGGSGGVSMNLDVTIFL